MAPMWDVAIEDGLAVRMTGWTALSCGRRSVTIPGSLIRSARVERRGDLEPEIDSRILGIGTNVGSSRRARTRVGRFLGRATIGKQFWAVPAGDPSTMTLVVVDCEPSAQFSRLVFHVTDPDAVVDRLRSMTGER